MARARANFVTDFHAYLVKVRELGTAKDFASNITALEARALNLWKTRDTKDLEDLLLELEKETLTPQLVAMILLTGRSLLKVKEDTSKGGKVVNSKFADLEAELTSGWQAYTGRLGKAAYASTSFSRWMQENERLKQQGKPQRKLPAPDTAKKWLTGLESARQRDKKRAHST